MTNFKGDAIEIENAPVTLQGATTPRFKLFRQGVIEPTDATSAGRDSHEGLSDFSHFVGARPSDNHLRQAFCHLLFLPTLAIKELSVELSFTVVFALSDPGSDQRRLPDHGYSCRCGILSVRGYTLPIVLEDDWVSSSRMIASITTCTAPRMCSRKC